MQICRLPSCEVLSFIEAHGCSTVKQHFLLFFDVEILIRAGRLLFFARSGRASAWAPRACVRGRRWVDPARCRRLGRVMAAPRLRLPACACTPACAGAVPPRSAVTPNDEDHHHHHHTPVRARHLLVLTAAHVVNAASLAHHPSHGIAAAFFLSSVQPRMQFTPDEGLQSSRLSRLVSLVSLEYSCRTRRRSWRNCARARRHARTHRQTQTLARHHTHEAAIA